MPEAWQVTAARFVGSYKVKDPASTREALADDMQLQAEIEEGGEIWMRSTLRRVSSANGYFIAETKGGENVVLLSYDADSETFDVCGGYVGPSLWVRWSSRGKGLAAELVAAKAALVGTDINPESYTTAGRAAHCAGHRLVVERAVAEGYRVAQEVLNDYPHLLPSFARSVARAKHNRGSDPTLTVPTPQNAPPAATANR
jgi:predicted GNAT family acetyltransferase